MNRRSRLASTPSSLGDWPHAGAPEHQRATAFLVRSRMCRGSQTPARDGCVQLDSTRAAESPWNLAVQSPSDGVAEFWLGRGVEYRGWLEEGHRTARNLLGMLAWRVCHGHFYRILQGPAGIRRFRAAIS